MTGGADATERLAYLADTVDLLWPGLNGSGPLVPMTVVPNPRAPRLLVPLRPRRAAAEAVRRYTAQQGPRGRLAGLALAAGIRAGVHARWRPVRSQAPRGESISDHLAGVFGMPVVATLALTHKRPNRKPVLQVFDTAGRCLGFAKVGVGPLAAQLVDGEAAGIAAVARAGLPHVEVPALMHHGRWQDLPVLVTAPLPMRRAPRPDDEVLVAAMREVSMLADGAMADYLTAIRGRAAALGARGEQWTAVLDDVVATRCTDTVPVGAWHGDFTEWNCARNGGRLMVWDWERFTAPAPQGFDRLHFVLNNRVRADRELFRAAAEELVAEAPHLLAHWRMTDDDARTVALLYLLDIALRYLADDLRSTDAGGHVEHWVYPVVRSELRRSPQPHSR